MRYISKNFPKTSLFSLNWAEITEVAESIPDIQSDMLKILKSPETLERPLQDLIPLIRAIDPSSRGNYLEAFIRSRFNMQKSPDSGDAIINGEEVEIKTSVLSSEKNASFKQVRYNNAIKHYWFLVVSQDNTFKMYSLNRDQAMGQSEEKGWTTSHHVTTGEFNERDLYSLQFDMSWNDCEIDCSCLNRTEKSEYPDLFQ